MYISSITAGDAIAGREWSGLKMNAWAWNLVPASLRQPSSRLLVLKHCSGSLLLKITHWRFLKVVQWATIVTVRGSMTGRLLKFNHIYIYIYILKIILIIQNYSHYTADTNLICQQFAMLNMNTFKFRNGHLKAI